MSAAVTPLTKKSRLSGSIDWVNPKVAVRDTKKIGLGLIATDLIPKGSTVILFGGKIMTWNEVLSLDPDMQDIPYQIADDLFFGIERREDLGIGERINHSCNPNCGFTSEMKLIAIRDIFPGEDVTMDYATCTSLDSYRLECRCDEPNCRGFVTGNDWKISEIQDRLSEYYQPYLKEKLKPRSIKVRMGRLLIQLGNLLESC